ncbi:hypothetical protein U729_3200 (plasmid) [Clostridium baratii str. Sullivan]|uniref:DNA 3'-5' helicase n=1 Tax=Clostridium baratii str. Sullivan TaxID=1415775 RepID=A0A0A7G0H3_9CLOT|nr:ATP-dependent helicase [Clostridium baratii]AIY85317.1 hypothetical protein U729_3200 [Clostridium baratii str. Sullivan]
MKLNEKQLNAVTKSIDKNTLLLAGPGSGKSSTLAERTKYIVNELKVNEENIMIITFTVKAANELKKKIKDKVKDYDKITIGTFHSVCLNLLKKFKKDLYFKKLSVLSSTESGDMLRKALANEGAICDSHTFKDYKSEISILKGNLKSSTHLMKRFTCDEEHQFATVYERYQRLLIKDSLVDYDDIIMYTVTLLRTSKRALDYCRNKFKYIMCDEVQDCNYAQFKFLQLIYEGNNLFLVGDEAQAIYGFRGTSPEYMIEFQKNFKNTQILELNQNYRSTKIIVKACDALINHSSKGFIKNSVTENEYGYPIIVKKCKNSTDEAYFVKAMIEKAKENSDAKYSDFCVLYRNNKQCEVIKTVFRKNKIPYNVKGDNIFYSYMEIKNILTIIKFAVNRQDKRYFKNVAELIPGTNDTVIDSAVAKARLEQIDYLTALKTCRVETGFINEVNKFIELVNIYNKVKPYIYIKNVADYLKERVYKCNWSTKELENIKDLIHLCDTHCTENNASINEFIDYVTVNLPQPTRRKIDCVTLSTVHSSKGLEYTNVFLIGADNKTFCKYSNESKTDENRRLFYVALSRAKKKVYISYSILKKTKHMTDTLKATEFISEIPSKYLAYSD